MVVWTAGLTAIDVIAELDSSCYKSHSLPKEKWADLLLDSKKLTLVVGTTSSPVAFITIGTDGKTNTIFRLAVASEERHKKIATALVDLVSSNRATKILVRESNSDGIQFLKSQNFKAVKLLRDKFGTEDGILFLRNP